jgi:hypothetical protein
MNWFPMGVLVAALLTGCSSSSDGASSAAAISGPPAHATRKEITKAARQDAAAAISSGQLYVCDAGTIALYSPGIPPDKTPLVRNLRHRTLPSGCTAPGALNSVAYAEIFNREIVRFLETKEKHQRRENKKLSSVGPVAVPPLSAGERSGRASSIARFDPLVSSRD